MSALRQRFGRLDRLGEIGKTSSVILARKKDISEKDAANAAVYGEDIHATWQWLREREKAGSIDFGVDALAQALRETPPPRERAPHAPLLLPAHIDLFTQTGCDAPAIDPAPFLHGPQRASNEISVIWRADLNPNHPETWKEHILAFPPLLQEALQIPIRGLGDILTGRSTADIADIEGMGDRGDDNSPVKPYLIWRGPDDCGHYDRLAEVRPGDTVILPAVYGGCDAYGWNPGEKEAVADVADHCAHEYGSSYRLRLTAETAEWLGEMKSQVLACVEALRAAVKGDAVNGVDEEAVDEARQALQETLAQVPHEFVQGLDADWSIHFLSLGGAVIQAKSLADWEGGTSKGIRVPLENHLNAVADMAAQLSADDPHAEIVTQAARHHDTGKSEFGFQVMLHGNPLKAAQGPLLAKSGIRTAVARKAAFERCGLPKGYRHELHSLKQCPVDNPLLGHLIATHHGYGRPWFPKCESTEEYEGMETIRLSSGWARRFASLRREVGPWRLAGLELLVRAADIRTSLKEQES